MKILAVMTLLAVVALSESLNEGKVNVQTFAEGGQFAVAVRVHDVPNANHAIVTYQYWEETSGYGRLLRTRQETIEVVPDAFVMGNGIAAERTQVRNVEVILVKDLEKHNFVFAIK